MSDTREPREPEGSTQRHLERAVPLALFVLALAVYWGGLWLHTGEPFPQSRWPYFVYYAGALLEGQLDFGALPPAGLDLAVYEGRVYMPFPPFPALPFLPLVAGFGLGVTDRFVCVLLGAANGPLLYALLSALDRTRLLRVGIGARVFLCLFFLFGTPHLYLAITSNVWEFAHVVCSALLMLTLWGILGRRSVVAAVALVGVLFTRTHVFLATPALVGLYWLLAGEAGLDARARLRVLAPAAAVAVGGVLLLLAFNAARFGDPFESGLTYHRMHEIFQTRFETWGALHQAHLPRNLGVLLLGAPIAAPEFPYFTFSPRGLSLFLTSPLYLYLLASLRAPNRRLGALLWCGVAPAATPILLFMGSGELQFGYRYASDLAVFLVILTYLGMGARVTRPALVLLGLSIAMNAYGAWWFVSHYAS